MTKTVTHEGVEYRKVSRKAEVGELVYVISCAELPELDFKIGVCTRNSGYSSDNSIRIGIPTTLYGQYGFLSGDYDEYLVLEPIESEATPVEASPTVIELLANISRRLYEVEEALKPKHYAKVGPGDTAIISTSSIPTDLNGKQLRIYTGEDIEGDYKTLVTVGIDEDTGVMYVLGTRLEALE